MLFAASFNFGKFLLLDAASGGVMAGLSDRKLAMPAVPPDALGVDSPHAACCMPRTLLSRSFFHKTSSWHSASATDSNHAASMLGNLRSSVTYYRAGGIARLLIAGLNPAC